MRLLVETITETVTTTAALFPEHSTDLAARLRRLVDVTETLWEDGDAAAALAHATDYLEATGHIVVAWIWLDMAHAAEAAGSPLAAGKLAAAEYFFTRELPKVDPVLDRLARPDSLLNDLDEEHLLTVPRLSRLSRRSEVRISPARGGSQRRLRRRS